MATAPTRALITGITGQDGRLLAHHLLAQGMQVTGTVRPGGSAAARRLSQLPAQVSLVEVDLLDLDALTGLLSATQPHQIYHLAAQTAPGASWSYPVVTAEITALGALRLFEAARRIAPDARLFQASSSEMFGTGHEQPCHEDTRLQPVNPYAVAKVYAHQMAQLYRRHHGMFIACGILFNHESPLRDLRFVTQKIAHGAACARLGITNSPFLNEAGEPLVTNAKLALGNLDTARDWTDARDTVRAMALMLTTASASDYVIGSGTVRSLGEFCASAYAHVGLDWRDHVVSDARFLRPAETDPLVADPSKAARDLAWSPRVSFADLVAGMVDAQVLALRRHRPD
jgi:GDPmannose 4,6-dehydratase